MGKIDNKYSAEWQAVKKFLTEKIDDLHQQNESDLDETETAAVRGQIRLAREVLALEDDPMPTETVVSTEYT